MPKVLISDKLSESAAAVFENRGLAVDFKPGLPADELKGVIGDYEGLAIRSATRVTAELLDAAGRLAVVGRAGIGVDNVDVPAATAKGVVVMNTPFGNTVTTAEHAISMMMATARQIPAADISTRAGKWEKSRFMGVELYGKTLGVIGVGNIGSIVADRAQGLKMRVIAYDPFLSDARARELNIEKAELDDLLARADFVTLHTPLNDATRGLIDAGAIARMKNGVRIVNCARGGLVVEEDLRAALESGKVAGAAFDVFAEEPARDNVLFGAPNFIATPHLGASTGEAQENVAVQVAEQMADYLLTGAVTNALNMPSVSAEDAPRLRPYMTLAEQLGGFAGQLTETGLREVRIEYEGAVARLNTAPLTSQALAGLLRPMLETVNPVSAPVIARQRDIAVSEVRHDRPSDYQSLIRLTVATDRQERSVEGSLFAERPRIVSIKGIPIEAEVCRHMLYIANEDRPGFIGAFGSLLGEHGVNIGTFNLGRDRVGGDAIAFVSIDQPLDEALLAKVRALPHIRQAKPLTFAVNGCGPFGG